MPRDALADAVAVVAFVTVGLAAHGKGLTVDGYARDAVPLLGCWFAAALAFGLYRRPSRRSFAATWLVGVAAGIGVRALVVSDPAGEQLTFLAVALAFTLLFVLAARGATSLAETSLTPVALRVGGPPRVRARSRAALPWRWRRRPRAAGRRR